MLAECIISIILFLFVILALIWALKDPTKEKLYFLGFTILLFTTIYAISFLHLKIKGAGIDISKEAQEVKIAKEEVKIAKEEVKSDKIVVDNERNEIETMKKEIITVRDATKEVAKATAEIAILNFGREDYLALSSTEKTAKKDEIRESLIAALKALNAQNVDISQVEQIYHISGDK